MGQRRIDREWPKPRHTRHVWIASRGLHKPPQQGYVLEWRRHSYKWSALVLYATEIDGRSVYMQEWIPKEMLAPVRTDPNRAFQWPAR